MQIVIVNAEKFLIARSSRGDVGETIHREYFLQCRITTYRDVNYDIITHPLNDVQYIHTGEFKFRIEKRSVAEKDYRAAGSVARISDSIAVVEWVELGHPF
jgi:hypothetical protein